MTALVARARARGLYSGDRPSFDQGLRFARQSLANQKLKQAQGALETARGVLQTFRADQAFAERKMARVEGAISRARFASEAERQRIAALSEQILRRIIAKRYVAASQLMSRVLAQLPADSR